MEWLLLFSLLWLMTTRAFWYALLGLSSLLLFYALFKSAGWGVLIPISPLALACLSQALRTHPKKPTRAPQCRPTADYKMTVRVEFTDEPGHPLNSRQSMKRLDRDPGKDGPGR